jgi:hypothetical protein
MMLEVRDEDIDRLVGHRRLVWLLGAGASFASGLPLMDGLTARVINILETNKQSVKDINGIFIPVEEFIDSVLCDIGKHCTVEQVLDHVADYLAMARRSASKAVATARGNIRYDEIAEIRMHILRAIKLTIRFGYKHDLDAAKQVIGTPEEPIVDVANHLNFIDALFGQVLAARTSTPPVEIFTTNYDTLIEDALSLQSIEYVDGFSGGAIGFWNPKTYEDLKPHSRVRLYKIHGSVDWTTTAEGTIIRRRIGDRYPNNAPDLLIYPQATKYDLTKREPYDSLFQRFRDVLNGREARVLAICGYGFGDDHINHDIENAMSRQGSDLTLLIFAKNANGVVERWLNRSFGERVYVLSEDGMRRGSGPLCSPPSKGTHDWWTFTGMTSRLRSAHFAVGAA